MAKITIDSEKCVGCGKCIEGCPAEVLELQPLENKKKCVPVHPENCIYCVYCMDHCDYEAICVYTPEGHLATEVLDALRG